MLNRGSGLDEVRFYAVLYRMAESARAELRDEVLARLVDATERAADERARCRDTDVAAATRVRPW